MVADVGNWRWSKVGGSGGGLLVVVVVGAVVAVAAAVAGVMDIAGGPEGGHGHRLCTGPEVHRVKCGVHLLHAGRALGPAPLPRPGKLYPQFRRKMYRSKNPHADLCLRGMLARAENGAILQTVMKLFVSSGSGQSRTFCVEARNCAQDASGRKTEETLAHTNAPYLSHQVLLHA